MSNIDAIIEDHKRRMDELHAKRQAEVEETFRRLRRQTTEILTVSMLVGFAFGFAFGWLAGAAIDAQ